jgi:hypothetical protein
MLIFIVFILVACFFYLLGKPKQCCDCVDQIDVETIAYILKSMACSLEQIATRFAPNPAVEFIIQFGTKKGDYSMFDNQNVTATLVPGNDAAGNPGTMPTFDAPPSWTSSGLVVLTPSADGLSCNLKASGIGTSTISVSASVGGVAISAQGTLTILAGAATSLTMSFGTPVNN